MRKACLVTSTSAGACSTDPGHDNLHMLDLQETSALTILEPVKKKHPSEIIKYSREQLLRQDQVWTDKACLLVTSHGKLPVSLIANI